MQPSAAHVNAMLHSKSVSDDALILGGVRPAGAHPFPRRSRVSPCPSPAGACGWMVERGNCWGAPSASADAACAGHNHTRGRTADSSTITAPSRRVHLPGKCVGGREAASDGGRPRAVHARVAVECGAATCAGGSRQVGSVSRQSTKRDTIQQSAAAVQCPIERGTGYYFDGGPGGAAS